MPLPNYLDRIAESVRRSPASCAYFAEVADPSVRDAAEVYLKAALDGRLHRVEHRIAAGDPWNTVNSVRLASNIPTRGNLFTLHVELPAGPVHAGGHPYEQLNFCRDGWHSTGAHVLVWVPNLDDFVAKASDLWAFRRVVVDEAACRKALGI